MNILRKLFAKKRIAWSPFRSPGDIVHMSDRSYLVRKDGSWKRLVPGDVIQVGKQGFRVGPNGRTLWPLEEKAA